MLYLILTGEFYKIGYTKDFDTLRSRIKTYKTDNPMFKLLDINLGNRDDETKVHRDIELDSGEWSKDKETTLDLWFSLKEPIAQKLIDGEKDFADYNCLRTIQLEEENTRIHSAYRTLMEEIIPTALCHDERLKHIERRLGCTSPESEESKEALEVLREAIKLSLSYNRAK